MFIFMLLCSQPFSELFGDQTLRMDYQHMGTADQEYFTVEQLRSESPWSGSRTKLIDQLRFGAYRFEIRAQGSGLVYFAQGYSSIFGEWQTTQEANGGGWRNFSESIRFPEPKVPVDVVIQKRIDGVFRDLWSHSIDPAKTFINRAKIAQAGEITDWVNHGNLESHLDLLILGDGYTAGETAAFHKAAQELCEELFRVEPFRSLKDRFNVRMLAPPAAESGISDPRGGVWRESPLGLSFNAFGSDRYVLTSQNVRLREAAAQAPYDVLVILANDRKYGGAGIYNLWATVTAKSDYAPYVFIHELGHSLAGLADEYYTSSVAYQLDPDQITEPWEANVTALLPNQPLKWAQWVQPETPIPTPWSQAKFDAVMQEHQKIRAEATHKQVSPTAMEALFHAVGEAIKPILSETPQGQVGAFEGAGYRAKGLYRPEVDCIMFTRNPKHFCRVCRNTLEQVILSHID